MSVLWLATLAFVWWLLTAPDSGAWLVGLGAVAFGGLLHLALGGASTVRPRLFGFLRFAPFFLHQMVRGGLDVSRRALSPSLPLEPDLVGFRTRLPEGVARVVFINAISLLPGTFSAQVAGDEITVHRLDAGMVSEGLLRTLEERVGGLFGLESDAEDG